MVRSKLLKPSIFLIAFIRVITPILIFSNPIFGIIAALLGDGIDYRLLVRALKLKHSDYQVFDKCLDFYWYILIIIYLLINETQQNILTLFITLFIIRLIGQILIMVTQKESFLFFFPNILEYAFWGYVIFPSTFTQYSNLSILVIFLIPIKLIQEYLLHIRRWDLIDHLKLLTKI